MTLGDMVIVRRHNLNPLDLAIELATNFDGVHVAMVGDGYLIEALFHVQASPLDKYGKFGVVFRPMVMESVKVRAVEFAKSKIGQRYGIKQLLEDGLLDIAHVSIGARFYPRHYTCSLLYSTAYAVAGWPVTYAPLATPADLGYSPVFKGDRWWVKSKEED